MICRYIRDVTTVPGLPCCPVSFLEVATATVTAENVGYPTQHIVNMWQNLGQLWRFQDTLYKCKYIEIKSHTPHILVLVTVHHSASFKMYPILSQNLLGMEFG